MQSSLEILQDRLITPVGYPTLLLGAGFSLGATNVDGLGMPLGKQLVEELYQNILVPHIRSIQDYASDSEGVESARKIGDLKTFCTFLRDFGLECERDKYITERMRVRRWGKEIAFEALATYPWTYIFTLNMDDLVEKIYKNEGKPLTVWRRGCQSYVENPKETILVKLHGDINDSIPMGQYRYILDNEEYSDFTASNDRMLQKFGEVYVSNDLIILGTQFQENDLDIVLKSLLKNGCNNENIQYFFISPGNFRRGLANKIDVNRNFHHIRMKNSEFLTFIKNISMNYQSKKRLLFSNAFSDWNKDLQEAATVEKTYELYNGAEPNAGDFFHKIDIRRHISIIDQSNRRFVLMENVLQANFMNRKNVLLTIHGEAYVGKTCLAMRLLTACSEHGYQSFYTRNVDLRIIEKVKDFLGKQPDKFKIALCMESAALYYNKIEELFNDVGENGALIIITTSKEFFHKTKQYLLQNICNRIDCNLNEKISYMEARDIYKTLRTHNRLGRLQSATTKPGDIKRKIREIGDFIDVLWYAHEGRSFSSYFDGWYQQKQQEEQIEIFELLTFYASLGCEFSIDVLPSIAQFVDNSKFDYRKFKDSFSDFWSEESGRIRLRYVRLFGDIVVKKIPVRKKIEWLQLLMAFLGGRIKEREYSRDSLMFETISKIRNISMQKNVTPSDILRLFSKVELACRHLSYYWIQRCIIYSKCEKFEDAANAIANAEAARRYRTYQIIHADAKNDMARGIWCIDHAPDEADKFFFRGTEKMFSLIEERGKYRAALPFSVHTYVNMSIKYYCGCNVEPDIREWYRLCKAMSLSVNTLPAQDRIFSRLVKKFIKFAEDIGREGNVKTLLYELQRKPLRLMEESDYDIDALSEIKNL